MAYEDKKDKPPKEWCYYLCEKCDKKVSFDRRYCACGNDMAMPVNGRMRAIHKVKQDNPPDMFKLKNLDTPSVPCDSCMGNCSYCASFGVPEKNGDGWGGLDCEHKTNFIKCTCCQLMIKRYEDTPGINNAIEAALRGKDNILANRNSGNPNLSQNYREAV